MKVEGEATAVGKRQDYEKTSLKPYVDYFRAFVAKLMKEGREAEISNIDNMEF